MSDIVAREMIEEKKIKEQTLFDNLCSRAGFWDLKPDDRSEGKPLRRQAVWCVMREMGVTFQEIAEQSQRSHGTVVVGVKRFKGFLSVNYKEAIRMYQKVIKVAQNGKEQY